MAIRVSTKIDATPLQGLETFQRNIDTALVQINQQVVAKHGTRIVQPLRRRRPGRSRHGGRWSTNAAANRRAQRWWWWAVSTGRVRTNAQGRYIRTGRTQKGWTFVADGRIIRLQNATRGARYVYTFARRIRPRGGRPNPGHIATGWPQQAQALGFQAIEEIQNEVADAFARTIAATISTGQFTVRVP